MAKENEFDLVEEYKKTRDSKQWGTTSFAKYEPVTQWIENSLSWFCFFHFGGHTVRKKEVFLSFSFARSALQKIASVEKIKVKIFQKRKEPTRSDL